MSKLILFHISDTHGLPRKKVVDRADVIVHTGDLFPNRTRGNRFVEVPYQTLWLEKTANDWAKWAGGRPVILVNGNHDYIDPVPIFRAHGIHAVNVEGRVIDLHGFRFMGLPDIPWMGGEWNHERQEDEIDEHFNMIMDYEPDVVVAHCPPYGILDTPDAYGGAHIGSTAISNALSYRDHVPLAYLCGHCHERGGRKDMVRGMIVSNAATSANVIEIEK